jgi:hypothetical protein
MIQRHLTFLKQTTAEPLSTSRACVRSIENRIEENRTTYENIGMLEYEASYRSRRE